MLACTRRFAAVTAARLPTSPLDFRPAAARCLAKFGTDCDQTVLRVAAVPLSRPRRGLGYAIAFPLSSADADNLGHPAHAARG